MGLGHRYGDPSSSGRKGLTISTTAKAPLGRPCGYESRFFFFVACRGRGRRGLLQTRRVSNGSNSGWRRWPCGSAIWWPLVISPGWCCDFSFEGHIACGLADLFRLVNSRVRCCSRGHCPGGGPCRSGRGRALSRRRYQAVWRRLLVASNAAGDVNWRSNCIFDVD